MPDSPIPEAILEDEALAGRLKVSLGEALAATMDASEWKKVAILHGLTAQILEHDRFMRSLRFGDPDYEGWVIDLVRYLFERNPHALVELFERPAVQRWFKTNDPKTLALFENDPDPLIEAITHSLAETAAVRDVIDLSQYTTRIQAALPGDPYQAIGATKDMLEATMRTILSRRGFQKVEKLDFPALTIQCLTELGVVANTEPTTKSARHLRKIAGAAKTMIETANELRNLAGTGHGHVVGEEEEVTAVDASLVASSGLVLAAWLARKAEDSK